MFKDRLLEFLLLGLVVELKYQGLLIGKRHDISRVIGSESQEGDLTLFQTRQGCHGTRGGIGRVPSSGI